MFGRQRVPSFDGATEWLNSEPLTLAQLRGDTVLVNFWTLTCINWLRQEPHVRAWSQAYRDDGLVVIGVHTPEFTFEHETDRVHQAVKERDIAYPVALDNDFAIWSAFDNHYWPALYFLDGEGTVRDEHFGEGRYEQSERVIQRLLGVERELVSASVQGLGVEAEADWDHLRTPETYLGHGRSERFASPGGAAYDERRAYELPELLRFNHWALAGEWTIGRENAVLEQAGGSIAYRFHARDAHLVLSPGARGPDPLPCCCSTVTCPERHTAWTSTRTATACSWKAACTSWSASTARSASRRSRSPSRNPVPRRTRSRSGTVAIALSSAVLERDLLAQHRHDEPVVLELRQPGHRDDAHWPDAADHQRERATMRRVLLGRQAVLLGQRGPAVAADLAQVERAVAEARDDPGLPDHPRVVVRGRPGKRRMEELLAAAADVDDHGQVATPGLLDERDTQPPGVVVVEAVQLQLGLLGRQLGHGRPFVAYAVSAHQGSVPRRYPPGGTGWCARMPKIFMPRRGDLWVAERGRQSVQRKIARQVRQRYAGMSPAETSSSGIATSNAASTIGAPSTPIRAARRPVSYRRENDTASAPYPTAANRKSTR